jgi:hypothetical protein
MIITESGPPQRAAAAECDNTLDKPVKTITRSVNNGQT